MALPAIGDFVQTPLGKGVVRENRRNGAVVVLIAGRAVVVAAREISPVVPARAPKTRRTSAWDEQAASDGADLAGPSAAPAEIDLHGLTVDEALDRTTAAVNAALLGSRLQLRVIHGRSGGRIKAAVHKLLGGMPSVRHFRLDPHNPGVTLVDF